MTDYIPITEISERLGVGVRQAQRLARQGQIPSVRSGRKFRIPRLAWNAYLESQNKAALASVRFEKEENHAKTTVA